MAKSNSRKGVPNKNKQFLLRKLQDMYGDDFHPIMQMAKNAVVLQNIADKHNDGLISIKPGGASGPEMIDATSTAAAALTAWEKIVPYLEPKLKAIEIAGDEDRPLKLQEIVFVPVGPDD